jgi:adenosylcobinamide-GDP ribazoletransferase
VTGALAGGAGWAAAFAVPHVLAVAIAFGLSIALTGALHVDGFLDTCDALFASVPAPRRREILKDPHLGSFAVAGFAIVGVTWLAALWCIDPPRLPLALAFAACAARWIVVGIAFADGYELPGPRPPRAVHVGTGLLALALGWSYWGHAVVLLALGFVTVAIARAMRSRLDGRLNGDCLGFLIVCTEVAVLAAPDSRRRKGIGSAQGSPGG